MSLRIENVNKTLARYSIEPIDDDSPGLLDAVSGMGRSIEDASNALKSLGRDDDAKVMVYRSFDDDGIWAYKDPFMRRFGQLLDNGGREYISEIIKKGLESGHIDRVCGVALKCGNSNYVISLAKMRQEEFLSGAEYIAAEDGEINNSSYYASRLYEKLGRPEEIRKMIDFCIANKDYFNAKNMSGIKFRVDGRQAELNRSSSFSAKHAMIRNLSKPFDCESYATIYYEPETDDDNRVEDIGSFRRYWENGKVKKVEEIYEKSDHGRFFVGRSWHFSDDGSVEEESLDYFEDVGDGLNFMPVMKRSVIDHVIPHLADMLSGKEFETNKYLENITGVLPHINMPVFEHIT